MVQFSPKSKGKMTKKANHKKKKLVLKPFCWYCDREFVDERTLLFHQRAVHFRCQSRSCHKTFASVSALKTHMLQTHKTTIKYISRAMRSRANPDINPFISGMACVSIADLKERAARVAAQHPGRHVIVPKPMIQMADAVTDDVNKANPSTLARAVPNPLYGGLSLAEVVQLNKA
ncbi:BUB3-interacting and GLEBS motif-containing protein ZNF207 [Carpediemonas membranifera]|uniref:BUB3-interacting and GLEBS motif-containing protein ZNF207 n=1 Tax=Carpediemonas membranifera TaxID=201153 RepID=A0A8J6B5Z3_9EUKA|nr:BUB3-interacting and GLEBS motif-containing protein ZNF207 [Carpediemonas membranifera]|eukprot:KAG9396378.1 BUB3-interacting and GLEBS motif-containing protein ZNF207 [Carpediemonas membranifera]